MNSTSSCISYGARFALEPLVELHLRGFNGDRAMKSGIAGFPHFAHTPRADNRKNLVGTEFFAGERDIGL